MKYDFNSLPWHDAILKSLSIDRSRPGDNDTVRFVIDWPDDGPSSFIEFGKCYGLTAHMNFGIHTCECILAAECITASDELDALKAKWLKMTIDLDGIKCYQIITNSTGSVIKIYAFDFMIEDKGSE